MIIQSTRVWVDEAFQKAQIEIQKGKITALYPYGEKAVDRDYGDWKIIPGLIEMHCHGYNGMDANYANEEGLKYWMDGLAKEGVTSFLVTTSTAPEANLLQSFATISKVIDTYHEGTQGLGIHVEGPQISFNFKGAHNPYLIQKPNIEQFERWQKAADGKIRLICIAPEMDDDQALIKHCAAQGVRVTIGHTGATYADCEAGRAAGAGSFTHTFNGMLGVHHREPGSAGAAMSMDDMYAEVICDGVHVHFAVVKALARAKGKDRLILVTDAVQIKGLKPGIYEMPGRWVQVDEHGCGHLKDGRLAGSSNKLIDMVKNLVTKCDIEEVTAINASSKNVAKFLGLEHKGEIQVGYDADFTVIDDAYQVCQTIIMGEEKL